MFVGSNGYWFGTVGEATSLLSALDMGIKRPSVHYSIFMSSMVSGIHAYCHHQFSSTVSPCLLQYQINTNIHAEEYWYTALITTTIQPISLARRCSRLISIGHAWGEAWQKKLPIMPVLLS